MKKIKIVFHNDDGDDIGWLIDPDTKTFKAGKFNSTSEKLLEVTQEGVISDPQMFCKQISYALLAGIKNE